MYGSDSLARLMALHGPARGSWSNRARYEAGPFVVRFIPSRHSKLLFGRKVPFDGPLTCEDVHGLSPGAYRCGAVFGIRIEVAGISLYHQGSADLDDAQTIEPVDVFLAGITGRQVTPHYWRRILPRLDPRVLVPTHYDDFFAPLGRTAEARAPRRARRGAGGGPRGVVGDDGRGAHTRALSSREERAGS